jgi:hypothetical protein
MAITVTAEKQTINISIQNMIVDTFQRVTFGKFNMNLTANNAIVKLTTNWTEKAPVNTVWTQRY